MLTNRYYDKSDYCDFHLKMLFNEDARAMLREYPNCPSCLREKIEQEGRRQLDLLRASLRAEVPFDLQRHPDESQSDFKKRVMTARGIKDAD